MKLTELAQLIGTKALNSLLATGDALRMAQEQPRHFHNYFHRLRWRAFASPRRSERWVRVYKPNGKRECRRRFLQGADVNQIQSHKLGMVRPRHVFGDVA
jgi:hypothetical protein